MKNMDRFQAFRIIINFEKFFVLAIRLGIK